MPADVLPAMAARGPQPRGWVSQTATLDMKANTMETPQMHQGQHNAASAADYLYQIDLAPLELLRRAPERPDAVISMEKHDDVGWEVGVAATELRQTKLNASRTAGLVDKDIDIWKTVRVLLDHPDAADSRGPTLALVTTFVGR